MKKYILLLLLVSAFIVSACARQRVQNADLPQQALPKKNENRNELKDEIAKQAGTAYFSTVELAKYNPAYRFSVDIPHQNYLQIEYVPEIESINIYDPSADGESNIEKSRIFIRYFEASDFLTLSTVNILNKENTSSNGHHAVRYEIEKEAGVPDFPHQPSWRNRRHKLIDIRFSDNNPTYFYVFSYSPEYFKEINFENFIESIRFHNDGDGFTRPLAVDAEPYGNPRPIKKPFGIQVSPTNSPISPERFTGFHTGVDFEVLDSEKNGYIGVFAICGGKIISKRTADGYGGVVVQSCERESQPVSVIYGHIKLSSVDKNVGEYLVPGDLIAELGDEYSAETGGERKHLHLGIHKGTKIDLRGYVKNKSELDSWIDFSSFY